VQDTLGFVLLKNGKPEEALKALEQAEAALPNNPAVQYHLALAHKMLNQTAAASEHVQKALSFGDFPERSEATVMLSQMSSNQREAIQ
jgi:predicted Zn-dependent protease